MKRINEPTRWLEEGSDAPADVRALIADARGALAPTSEELARLGAFVAGAAGGAAGGGAAGAAKAAVMRHAMTKAAAVKLAAVLAVGSAGGAVGWSVLRRTEAPPVVAVPALHASSEAARGARETRETGTALPEADVKPPPVEIPGASPPPPPPSAWSVASPGARTTKGSAVATAGASPTGTSAPSVAPATASTPGASTSTEGQTAIAQMPGSESELTLLDRARARMAPDPAAAMRALDAHLALYPRGTFAQEREVLAIEALVRLGRRPEAEARAAAFESAFPGSAHRRRIAVLLSDDAGL